MEPYECFLYLDKPNPRILNLMAVSPTILLINKDCVHLLEASIKCGNERDHVINSVSVLAVVHVRFNVEHRQSLRVELCDPVVDEFLNRAECRYLLLELK